MPVLYTASACSQFGDRL